MSELHHLEKKYGIRINLLNWSGDDYETGTLRALIKLSGTDVGRILLESIAYCVKHKPQNLLKGVLQIRPYGDTGCNGMATPEKTTKAGKRIQPVVSFWPKAYAKGGACSKYLEDHKDETGGVLPEEALFHELVHAFRMASGESESQPLTQGGLMNYDSVEEFIAVLVTNIYITDPSNKSHSNLRRDHASFKTLEPTLGESFTFFQSSVSTYRLMEQFCGENPGFTRRLADVKASFNPISAFYKDPMQAWIYANSKVAVGRDNLGPEIWDLFQEIRKYSVTTDPAPGEKFLNRLQNSRAK
jgi:hypothetical protein